MKLSGGIIVSAWIGRFNRPVSVFDTKSIEDPLKFLEQLAKNILRP